MILVEESVKKDAERYRKLRELAIKWNTLEAIIALGGFDHFADGAYDRFDRDIDRELEDFFSRHA